MLVKSLDTKGLNADDRNAGGKIYHFYRQLAEFKPYLVVFIGTKGNSLMDFLS
jgi:hypothetical protein